MASERYDVIIIGTGAGGGTLAYRLAPSGKRILLLERGDFLPRERDNWDSTAVFADAKYQVKETWYGKDGRSFHPGLHYWVGGNTKVYGAALLRLRKEDFGEIKHHGGISPAWPLAYEDFEPYYCEAEDLYRVHGERGVDPTEPPASRPYRYPPVSHEPRIQELHDALKREGHHPFPLPLGVLLDEENGKPRHTSACVRCDAFDGYPCLVNGKADAQIICVEPALQHPNVTLLTNAYVKRLETDSSGRTPPLRKQRVRLRELAIGRAVYEARIAPCRGPIARRGHRPMSPSSAATAATRYLLVSLFFPFSALDKILNHKGAVAQAREVLPEGPARLAILVGLGIEIVMPLAILTGVADRLAASVMAGYCGATALLWKRFWKPGDFWQAGHSQGRELFWDFLKNFSLAGGFLLITFGTKGSEVRDFLSHPLRSSHPYKLPEGLR